jgi:S-methylmethionine-dependent homocysteine/selenocysteine methylase
MPRYREELPQLEMTPFLTDSGLETDLLFNHGFELPSFAAFVLLEDAKGRSAIETYVRTHAQLAAENEVGIVIETPTWRANSDWAGPLGYDSNALADVNRDAVAVLVGVRDERGADAPPLVISGAIGPRGDGYQPTSVMSAQEAEEYHAVQIETFAATDVDLVSALTLTYVDEAIGVARAAKASGVPCVISFTVETDGALPDGTDLTAAIAAVDEATDSSPAYYMVNCAHPIHFDSAVRAAGVSGRLRGIRANASRMSHAELDNSEVLDEGNPAELAEQFRVLRVDLPVVSIVGGCCGTDLRHIEAIAAACL